MAFLFLVVLAIGITFIGWQLYQKKVASVPAKTPANPGGVTPSSPPQATPDPLIQTPVGALTPSTAAYYDPNRPDAAPGSQVDSVDRNSRVLSEIGGWRYIKAQSDTLQVPNVNGYLMIDAAEPNSDITISLYKDFLPVISTAGKNDVTLQYPNASGDYYIVLEVQNVSGQGTVNRKGA